jgi:hypothetical protein
VNADVDFNTLTADIDLAFRKGRAISQWLCNSWRTN